MPALTSPQGGFRTNKRQAVKSEEVFAFMWPTVCTISVHFKTLKVQILINSHLSHSDRTIRPGVWRLLMRVPLHSQTLHQKTPPQLQAT